MGVGKSSFAYGEGQMDDDDLYRLRRSLFPDYPDGMNIKSLIRDPVNAVLFRIRSVFAPACRLLLLARCLQLVRCVNSFLLEADTSINRREWY